MAKKANTKKRKSGTEKKSETLKSQICNKKRQMILNKLRQVTVSRVNDNSSDFVLPRARNLTRVPPESENHRSTETDANGFDKNDAHDDYTCYRCKHFAEIPRNLSLPLAKTAPAFIGRCEAELNFVQAIVWLKSAAASVSQISVGQLRRIFHRQWQNAYDNALNSPVFSNRICDVSSEETIRRTNIIREAASNGILDLAGSRDDPSGSFVNEISTPERRITVNEGRRDSSLRFRVIPETDDDDSCSSSLSDMFQSPYTCSNVSRNENPGWSQLERDAHFTVDNYQIDRRTNKENERDVYFTRQGCTDTSSKCESASFGRDWSVKSTLILDRYSEGSTSNRRDLINEFSLPSDCGSNNFSITEIDTTLSQISNVSICHGSVDDSQIDRMQPTFSDDNDTSFEFQVDDIDFNAWANDVSVGNAKNDSAYSTSNTVITCERTKRTGDKCTPVPETGHRFKLQSCKKKSIAHKDIINSPSLIEGMKMHKRPYFFPLSEEPRYSSGSSPKEDSETNVEATISANWLNFTLESLNVEHVIVESLKVILSILCDERTATDYVTRRCWKNTLEEDAVNAALNVSDILTMEKKPDICAREITTAIIESLHEITTGARLNQTSIWIYRVQIIFELCNSLSICIGIVDHLIEKLKSFQAVLINVKKIRQNTHAMINQLHLLFYALNIAVQKYRIIVPRNPEASRFMRNTIPNIADLWKRHYVDDEFKYTNLNLHTTETRWLNTLENFTTVSTKSFTRFAEKSFSLFHMLASQ